MLGPCPIEIQPVTAFVENLLERSVHLVEVFSVQGDRLHSCHPARARELIRKGRAVKRLPFKGIQLLPRKGELNQESSNAS